MLKLAAKTKRELQETQTEIATEEEKVNSLVYESYGLTQHERRIVEDFLGRYSSTANAVAEEQAEQLDEP